MSKGDARLRATFDAAEGHPATRIVEVGGRLILERSDLDAMGRARWTEYIAEDVLRYFFAVVPRTTWERVSTRTSAGFRHGLQDIRIFDTCGAERVPEFHRGRIVTYSMKNAHAADHEVEEVYVERDDPGVGPHLVCVGSHVQVRRVVLGALAALSELDLLRPPVEPSKKREVHLDAEELEEAGIVLLGPNDVEDGEPFRHEAPAPWVWFQTRPDEFEVHDGVGNTMGMVRVDRDGNWFWSAMWECGNGNCHHEHDKAGPAKDPVEGANLAEAHLRSVGSWGYGGGPT